jgi:hypothetical protein
MYLLGGPTLVNEGILFADGTLPNTPIAVSGGTLSGGGTIDAVTVRGGLLHPGSGGAHGSILTSQGSVVFEAGSSFETDIRGSGGNQYDQLTATGEIDLTNGGTSNRPLKGSGELTGQPGSPPRPNVGIDVLVALSASGLQYPPAGDERVECHSPAVGGAGR